MRRRQCGGVLMKKVRTSIFFAVGSFQFAGGAVVVVLSRLRTRRTYRQTPISPAKPAIAII